MTQQLDTQNNTMVLADALKEYDKHPMHPDIARDHYTSKKSLVTWLIFTLFLEIYAIVLFMMLSPANPLLFLATTAIIVLILLLLPLLGRLRNKKKLKKILLVWDKAPDYARQKLISHYSTPPEHLLTKAGKYKNLAIGSFIMTPLSIVIYSNLPYISTAPELLILFFVIIPLSCIATSVVLMIQSKRLKKRNLMLHGDFHRINAIMPALISSNDLKGGLSPDHVHAQGNLSMADTEPQEH